MQRRGPSVAWSLNTIERLLSERRRGRSGQSAACRLNWNVQQPLCLNIRRRCTSRHGVTRELLNTIGQSCCTVSPCSRR